MLQALGLIWIAYAFFSVLDKGNAYLNKCSFFSVSVYRRLQESSPEIEPMRKKKRVVPK